MKTVFKYRLDFSARTDLLLPLAAMTIFTEMQGGDPHVWILLDPQLEQIMQRSFRVYGTGHPIEGDAMHIGSMLDGLFIWHVFEVWS